MKQRQRSGINIGLFHDLGRPIFLLKIMLFCLCRNPRPSAFRFSLTFGVNENLTQGLKWR